MKKMEKIFDGVADRSTCFALLNRYQRDSVYAHLGLRAGQWFEIGEEEYGYFLDVLPPLSMIYGSFAMCEFTSGNLTESFHAFGDRYFCALLDWAGSGSLRSMRGALQGAANEL